MPAAEARREVATAYAVAGSPREEPGRRHGPGQPSGEGSPRDVHAGLRGGCAVRRRRAAAHRRRESRRPGTRRARSMGRSATCAWSSSDGPEPRGGAPRRRPVAKRSITPASAPTSQCTCARALPPSAARGEPQATGETRASARAEPRSQRSVERCSASPRSSSRRCADARRVRGLGHELEEAREIRAGGLDGAEARREHARARAAPAPSPASAR